MDSKEKFKLRLDLKTGNEEIDLYLYNLHNYVVSFETSSIKQMLVSLDGIAQKMIDDLDKIAQGDFEELVILSDDKDSKVFEKVQRIVEKIDSWKKVCETAESLRPEIEDRKKEVKNSLTISTNGSVYEEVLKQAQSNKKK